MKNKSSSWPAAGVMVNCDPHALVKIAIQAGSDNAPYNKVFIP